MDHGSVGPVLSNLCLPVPVAILASTSSTLAKDAGNSGKYGNTVCSRCLLGNVGGSVCPNKISLGKTFFFTNKRKGIVAETSKKKRLDLEIRAKRDESGNEQLRTPDSC